MKQRLAGRARLALFALLAMAVLGTVLGGAGSAGAFQGKNGRIAFDLNPKGTGDKIFVMNANGSHRKQVTRKPRCTRNCYEWEDIQPAWSPNGRKIAFTRSRDGGSTYRINVMNADGSRVKQLTHTRGSQTYDASPAWSPDGKKIAFTSRKLGVDDVYVMQADGSGVTQLTHQEGWLYAGNPAWSPDGTKIAFDSGGSWFVDVMNADGSNLRQIVTRPHNSPGDGGSTPAWSPDGTRIVYMMPEIDGTNELWVANADGTNQVQLTFSGPPRNVHYTRALFSQPSWSPDGLHIAYLKLERPRGTSVPQLSSISVMSPDGSGQRVVSKTGYHPDWGPIRR